MAVATFHKTILANGSQQNLQSCCGSIRFWNFELEPFELTLGHHILTYFNSLLFISGFYEQMCSFDSEFWMSRSDSNAPSEAHVVSCLLLLSFLESLNICEDRHTWKWLASLQVYIRHVALCAWTPRQRFEMVDNQTEVKVSASFPCRTELQGSVN